MFVADMKDVDNHAQSIAAGQQVVKSTKRNEDYSAETKSCLSEAEGGVSSFCQVFFGYFL